MDHEQRCLALYEAGNHGTGPVPDGLVVVGGTSCMLCKNSMRNNNYATKLEDGRAITWINIEEQAGIDRFYGMPGITYNEATETPMAAGHPLGGTPLYLYMHEGQVKLGAIGYGEQPEGGLDYIATTAACKLGIY